MRVNDKIRYNAAHNALRWLVDKSHGTALLVDIPYIHDVPTAVGRATKARGIADSLARAGHVEVQESEVESRRRKDGKSSIGRRVFVMSRITVTPAGYLWRDFLDGHVFDFGTTAVEWHARHAALMYALKPFAMSGKQLGEGLSVALPTALQWAIAAEAIYSETTGTIYPWTPLNFRQKGSIQRRVLHFDGKLLKAPRVKVPGRKRGRPRKVPVIAQAQT